MYGLYENNILFVSLLVKLLLLLILLMRYCFHRKYPVFFPVSSTDENFKYLNLFDNNISTNIFYVRNINSQYIESLHKLYPFMNTHSMATTIS